MKIMNKKFGATQKVKLELEKLADIMLNRWGVDCLGFDNFISLAKEVALKYDLDVYYTTIKRHEDLLANIILDKNITKENVMDLEEAFNLGIEQKEDYKVEEYDIKPQYLINPPETIKITIDGYEWEYKLNLPKLESEIEKEVEREWKGMFDYKLDGKVVIRNGKYKGCDVMDKMSIKQYFSDVFDLYSYICYCLSPKEIAKYEGKRDSEELEMNIDTLIELKEKIELAKPNDWSRFKIIRKLKGLN